MGSHVQAVGPQASFYGIGDLAGGPVASTVRDATKHNGVIYAVGASAVTSQPGLCETVSPNLPIGCFVQYNLDRPVLWTLDGATATLTMLPEIATSSSASGASAVSITPDAAFIASQSHSLPNKPEVHAVRVTTAALPAGSANEDLNAAPYQPFTFTGRINGVVETTTTAGAAAISDNGSILYGVAVQGNATVTPSTAFNRAVRYEVGVGSTLIPLLDPAIHVLNAPSGGTSSDGSVMVGTSSGGGGNRAFRYVHGTGVSAIPLLPGGSNNRALAVSPDGNLTLVSESTTFLPNGQVYLHNAASGALTALGSPNTPWQPSGVAGMTDDGSVVAITFVSPVFPCSGCPRSVGSRNAYIRNSHGWFHLMTVLAAANVEIWQNWDRLQITGMSPDGTLVFGQGTHNEELEGFVAEFPLNFLKTFDVPPVPPSNSTIVGAWRGIDDNPDPALANDLIVVLLADGTYFHMQANAPPNNSEGRNGYERGRYFWDPLTGAFSIVTVQDTDGNNGFSDVAGVSGLTANVAGDELTLAVTGCVPDPEVPECSLVLNRVSVSPGSLVGAWFSGNPAVDDMSAVLVLVGNGDYYFLQDGSSEPAPVGDPNGRDGIEKGTWTWDSFTHLFSTTTTVDTNGQWGLNAQFPLPGSQASVTLGLSPDEFRATGTDGVEAFSISRVAVATVVTPTGTAVPVQPTSPAGTTPVTILFDTVTVGGETTLQVIDPNSVPEGQTPPVGFALGDPPLYYEIQTTATFTGPVTVCFSYAGVTFPSGTPRLLHFDAALASWVDITTSENPATSTICGLTSSFSPFAIAASALTTTGFRAPINPVAGDRNLVKGGSTVPLKFNVRDANGAEITTSAGIANLAFLVTRVWCDANAEEVPVPFVTTGGTSLRYAGGFFIQNWKTPTAPGCYFVRVTGDGLLLSAVFKVK